MNKTFEAVMETLKGLGSETRRKTNAKYGAGENQFGVMTGSLRAMGKDIGIDHTLAMHLWSSGNADAIMLACIIIDPKQLTPEKARAMVLPLTYNIALDEFTLGPLAEAPFAQTLMLQWIHAPESSLGRAGWNLLIAMIIAKQALPFTMDEILDLIDKHLMTAVKQKQESMNRCLCEIGIRMREYTDRCIAIGEKYGPLDNRPIPKGCVSTYAPEWIAAGIRLREARKR